MLTATTIYLAVGVLFGEVVFWGIEKTGSHMSAAGYAFLVLTWPYWAVKLAKHVGKKG